MFPVQGKTLVYKDVGQTHAFTDVRCYLEFCEMFNNTDVE